MKKTTVLFTFLAFLGLALTLKKELWSIGIILNVISVTVIATMKKGD